jgi:hypothetical protein
LAPVPLEIVNARKGEAMQAYCVKEKKMMDIMNPQKITMKNGKPAWTGTCSNGHKLYRIGA